MGQLGLTPSNRTHERKESLYKHRFISRDTKTNKMIWKGGSKYCYLDIKTTAVLPFNIIMIIKITENEHLFIRVNSNCHLYVQHGPKIKIEISMQKY